MPLAYMVSKKAGLAEEKRRIETFSYGDQRDGRFDAARISSARRDAQHRAFDPLIGEGDAFELRGEKCQCRGIRDIAMDVDPESELITDAVRF